MGGAKHKFAVVVLTFYGLDKKSRPYVNSEPFDHAKFRFRMIFFLNLTIRIQTKGGPRKILSYLTALSRSGNKQKHVRNVSLLSNT